MKLKQLQTIIDRRPAVTTNTFLISALFAASLFLAAIFLILGLALILEGLFEFKIILNTVADALKMNPNEDQRRNISLVLGFISVLLAVVYAVAARVSKMVLQRNSFILDMEDWIAQNIKEIVLNKTK